MFGLEEYYNELLTEARSPEEIKKILEYQFVQGKGVPQEILDYIFSIDPTHKKTYTRWVLMQWENSKNIISDSINNGKLKKMFSTFKERESEGLNLVSMKSIEKAMEYIKNFDPILSGNQDKNLPENQYDIVFDSTDWMIAVPHTYEADKKLGAGCKWCTAGAYGDIDAYWEEYSSQGTLWVNFDKRKSEIAPKDNKEYPYTRYQFVFECRNGYGEMMNSRNERIDFKSIDMPEDVVEFYRSKNPSYIETFKRCRGESYDNYDDYGDGQYDNDREWEEYNDRRQELMIKVSDYFCLAPKQNDEMNLDCPYCLYYEDDLADSPFDNAKFDKNNCIIDSYEDCVLLKTIDGKYVVLEYDDCFLTSTAKEFGDVIILSYYDIITIFPHSNNKNGWVTSQCHPKGPTGIGDFFVNEQITQIANEHSMDGLAIEICYKKNGSLTDDSYNSLHTIGVKTSSDSGYKYSEHSLLWYNGEQTVVVIQNDIPLDNMFTAFYENGRLLIQSAVKEYELKNKFYEQRQITETFNKIYKSIIDAELHRYDD